MSRKRQREPEEPKAGGAGGEGEDVFAGALQRDEGGGFTYFQDRPDIMAKYTVRVEADKAKYAAIGESDRMTLRFVKPKIETAAE